MVPWPGRGLYEGGGYAKHPVRKYEEDLDGRIVRRHVLLRKSSFVGLAKEGTKLATGLKLGKSAGGIPSVFIDWKRRLLSMGCAEARRMGPPWHAVTKLKATLRRQGSLRKDALGRLKRALVAG